MDFSWEISRWDEAVAGREWERREEDEDDWGAPAQLNFFIKPIGA